MNRQQKEAVVSEVRDKLASSQATFLVGFKGLTVSKMQTLRDDLRKLDGTIKVTKARLMKIASEKIEGSADFNNHLKDQVCLVFAEKEVPPVAKALFDFSKKNNLLRVISGLFENKTLTTEQVDFLAKLPPKEVLLAQLAGTLQAPYASFARILHTMIARLLYALKQISEKEVSK